MYRTPDQLIALNKSNVEAAMRLAVVALQGVEKLFDLQIEAAKAALAEGATSARAMATVKDPKDLVDLRDRVLQPSVEKAQAYARDLYGVAATTQQELSKLIEAQVADFNQSVAQTLEDAAKNAPNGAEFALAALRSAVAGANIAFDNASRVGRQLAAINEASVAAATQSPASKKKAA